MKKILFFLSFGVFAQEQPNTFIYGPNLIESTESSSTDETLVATSPTNLVFEGATPQTWTLPDATTLLNGRSFRVFNNGTDNLTVNDNDAGEVVVVKPAADATLLLLDNGSTAGSWIVGAGGGGGGAGSLQEAYDGGQTVTVASNIPFSILDSATPSSGDLFRVGNNAADTFYTRINAQGLLASNLYGGNLTSGRVALTGSSGLLTDSSSFTYSGGVLNNTDGTSAVYRLTKSGTGAGSFEIGYFGTTAGAILNGASLTNPIYFAQGGNIQAHFQTDGDVRFYNSILLQESGGTDYVGINAPSVSTSWDLTLPAAAPSAAGLRMTSTDSVGATQWTRDRYVSDFSVNDITLTSDLNQTWRYNGASQAFDQFIFTSAVDGARITIINIGASVLTVPYNATGIVYQNGTKVLGQGESVTYEYVSALSGLVEVQ